MDKKAIRKMVNKHIVAIQKQSGVASFALWKRAREFSRIHKMVVWKNSPWGTFHKFCLEVLPEYNATSILTWVSSFNTINKYYSWAEITAISKALSYSVAIGYTPELKRRISVGQFIKKAKLAYTSKAKGPKIVNKTRNHNKICLFLSEYYVDKLESLLAVHGYNIPPSRDAKKHGISNAMARYLDTV